MMLTNDPFNYTGQQESAPAKPEQTRVFSVFGIYGVLPFLGQSLMKIKNNVTHPGFKKMIETYIEDHLPHAGQESFDSAQEIPVDDFRTNARIAYQKVMAEQDYLHRILRSLESEIPE